MFTGWYTIRSGETHRLGSEGSYCGVTLSFAIARIRSGFNATRANKAAMILRADATTNTAVQLPVAVVTTLANGTKRAAVPLAV